MICFPRTIKSNKILQLLVFLSFFLYLFLLYFLRNEAVLPKTIFMAWRKLKINFH